MALNTQHTQHTSNTAGATRGLGKALARQALLAGDSVIITGRSQAAADAASAELRFEVGALLAMRGGGGASDLSDLSGRVRGVACDVADAEQVRARAHNASRALSLAA